jgi:hypothetical protein
MGVSGSHKQQNTTPSNAGHKVSKNQAAASSLTLSRSIEIIKGKFLPLYAVKFNYTELIV